MNRKKDAMKMNIQAITQKIQATLGTERNINGVIEFLPSRICMKKVSNFTFIGNIFPMATVLFRTMYGILWLDKFLLFLSMSTIECFFNIPDKVLCPIAKSTLNKCDRYIVVVKILSSDKIYFE